MSGIMWWGLAPAALLLAAAAAELAARWWLRHRSAYYVFPPGQRIHLHPDPTVFPQLERLVRFEINSEGERGREVRRSRGGLYRVLVAGGSQPESYLLDQDTSWPGVLQRLLETPTHLQRLQAKAAHVGNIGRSGVASEGLDLILERVLPRYPRLQAIVILVGASDVIRWIEQGAPASRPAPVRASDVFRCHRDVAFAWRPGASGLAELLRRLRQRWLRPLDVHANACSWVGRARAMRARATDVSTTMPDPTPMLEHFELHFRRLLERAKRHADRVLVARQSWFDKDYNPEEAALMWHGGVGQPWREEVTTYYSFDIPSRLMALLDVRAARVADEVGVEQLDLSAVLEPSLRTYWDWLHLTPAGARTVAEAVASALLQRPRSSRALADLRRLAVSEQPTPQLVASRCVDSPAS
jgi:lysophospholipase L1-like esterase